MKKIILYIFGFGFNIFLCCQSNDQKNLSDEPYPTTDTNIRKEVKNVPETDSLKSTDMPANNGI